MVKVKLLGVAILFVVPLICHAQTKGQVTEWLERFCMEQYDSCFNPRQYIEGSLTVTTLESDEANNVIKVKGKHSYRGLHIPFVGRRTHSSVDFKAEIYVTESGFNIRFWKWFDDGLWEGPCEKTMILTDYKK